MLHDAIDADEPPGREAAMNPDNLARLEARVVRAAEGALADRKFVTAIDVLTGIGWLTPPQVDLWRQGRATSLEAEVQANLVKVSAAMRSSD